MESILKITGLVLGILNFIGIVVVGIFHKLVSDKLIGNDLFHLAKDVTEIKDEQKCMKAKLITVSEDVALLKGKIE
jgi:hypothetical protein